MTDTVRAAGRVTSRQPLVGDVYEAVRALLMELAIEPGSRISIDGLARDFGVSPTPVREAMARLESDGLVVKEPLKGYRATPLLTREELLDLYRFRQLVEPWAARRAAEQIDPDGVARLQAELAAASEVGLGHLGYRGFIGHAQRFHVVIAELSGSAQVRAAFERTHCHLHIFRLSQQCHFGVALAEHRTIAAAITHGDPEQAARAMSDHLATSLRARAGVC